MLDWARCLALLGEEVDGDLRVLAEATALTADSYPTRALYGHYLRDCFARIVAAAPPCVTVSAHRSRAVAIADAHGTPDGRQAVRLADGTRLDELDAIVLATGHVPTRLGPAGARAASLARVHGLDYHPPANPADVDLSRVGAGEPVLVRGLGLNFFDYLALFTVGRGGRFARTGGGLRYLRSGAEPALYASSRRGLPYHARGENQKGAFGRHEPRVLTTDVIDRLRTRAEAGELLQFRHDVWPLITREVESVYYERLLAERGLPTADVVAAHLAPHSRARVDEVLDRAGVAAPQRWSWERLDRPWAGCTFRNPDDFTAWVLGHLRADVELARRGNVDDPIKAALDVLRDLRNEIRQVVDHGGIDGESYRSELARWYTPLNAYLSIGPPAVRIEQLVALVEAGVVLLLGPDMLVELDTATSTFTGRSRLVPDSQVRASHLVEARIQEPDLRRTEDPLLRFMLDTGQCRPYMIRATGGDVETGGLAVTPRPYRVICTAAPQGHPRRFAYGIPTESVHWATAAGIRPCVDSVILGDADAIAAAVLALEPAGRLQVRGTASVAV